MTQNGYSKYSDEQVVEFANYIVENTCTYGEAAAHFNILKSTLGNQMVQRLPRINTELYQKVRIVCRANVSLKQMKNIPREELIRVRKKRYEQVVERYGL